MHEYFTSRLPLFYVFLSGIGFSLQTLLIKLLAEQGFHGSFQCVFFRGFIQFILASYFVYYDEERRAGKGPPLFGSTSFVKWMLFGRAFLGFGGIAFSFLAVELIPIGDATVLTMLSPLGASILGYLILGEPWRLPEFFATVVSLGGAVMVAKPPFIFGGETEGSSFYLGVTYALSASVFASCAYIFVRILGTTAKMPWANVCFAQAIGQILMALPSMYIFGQHLSFDISLLQLGMLLLGGLIGAISQILMTIGMQREKSAAATAMRMSDVAFGFVWQVCFTSDQLSLLSLGGALLVTSSIFIIVIFKQAPTPAADSSAISVVLDKSLEMKQLNAAIQSIAVSLQDSYDLEPGFEEDEESEVEHSKTATSPDSAHLEPPSLLNRFIQSPLFSKTNISTIRGKNNNTHVNHLYSTLAQAEQERSNSSSIFGEDEELGYLDEEQLEEADI